MRRAGLSGVENEEFVESQFRYTEELHCHQQHEVEPHILILVTYPLHAVSVSSNPWLLQVPKTKSGISKSANAH